MVTSGERRSGINWEIGIDIYTLLYIKQITYKDPYKASRVAQSVKNLPSVRDPGLIPGLGRFPGAGNGNPLQYPCLKNLMDRGAWWAEVHGVIKSWAQLSI